jgi:hypothetical protein
MNNQDNMPVKYLEARRALAACVQVDEAKEIRNQSVAFEAYAAQAKDAELISDATEIRKRAERRIGELMEQDRVAGMLAKGARKIGVGKRGSPADPRSLAGQGVDKHLADRSRKAAAMPVKQFEAEIKQAKKQAVAMIEGDKSIISAARARSHIEKKKRVEREVAVTAKITALPDKRYRVVGGLSWPREVENDAIGV